MLKQLVQLFAEKFLQSKREEVRGWTYPKSGDNNVIHIDGFVAATSFQYTPPADGIVQFIIRTNSQNIIKVAGPLYNLAPRTHSEYSKEWAITYYRVTKGCPIEFTIQSLATTNVNDVFFIPFN